jgi:pyrroline-5-carboxylate reductase
MNHPTVGFIVVGRVARIFLEGWTRAPKLPDRMVCGPARTRLSALFQKIKP